MREVPLENGLGIDIWLLQIDAPVFQLLERNRQPGDRATHEGTGPHDAKVAVEIFDLGLARHRGRAIEPVQHVPIPPQEGMRARGSLPAGVAQHPALDHNIVAGRELVTHRIENADTER
jgi:hypothetical protein